MANSTSSTVAPPAGSTAASHGSAKYSKDGTRVRITFRNGSQQTLPTIPKPQNIKKCKNIVDYLDFGEGKTFPRAMYLAIQLKIRKPLFKPGVDKSKGKDKGSSKPQGNHDDKVADKTEGEEGLIDELIEDGEEQLDDAPTEDDPTSGDKFEDNEMEAAEQEVDEVDLNLYENPICSGALRSSTGLSPN
ncbi:hypothetical protein BN14_09471 [Rhizoctonia solani AG-1 IB]|uniref:Uncharacterized protein n=1 Tax=Thanatephorus cucumeris (strain AG1-IB / isolate 7/3/14) TaxID=1108050 RepID=M5C5V2_THACB|nr:hypothetical protein BN14_09471 [Rhizoctonia solani AG-1 IB]